MNKTTKQLIEYCKKKIKESGIKNGYYAKMIETLKNKTK